MLQQVFSSSMKSDDSELPCLRRRGLAAMVFCITRELRTALDRRMAPYGLTYQQATLLIRCVHNQGASLNELVPHLGTDNAGVSRLVDRLEAADLVQRTRGADRRALALQATEAGIALAPKLEKVLGALNRELTAGLSAEEVAGTGELLGRIFINAKALNGARPGNRGGNACVH
jgi:DNA-binding MarR family transcriptional regulator